MTKLQEHYATIKDAALMRRMEDALIPTTLRTNVNVDRDIPAVIVNWLDRMITDETFLSDNCRSYLLQSVSVNSAALLPSIAAVLVRCDLAPVYTSGVALARALTTASDEATDFLELCASSDILIIDYLLFDTIWNDLTGEQRNYVSAFLQDQIQNGQCIITQGGLSPDDGYPIYLDGIVHAYFQVV